MGIERCVRRTREAEYEERKRMTETPPSRCFIPYHIYRWVVCFSVMVGLVPMAGTMTSFGAIKQAIQADQNCTTTEEGNSTVTSCSDWTDPAYVGFADLNPTMISLVASLVFGFTVGSSVITSPIIAKVGYRNGGLVGVALGIATSIATSYTTSFYYWFLSYSFLFGVANNLIYNTGMQMANAFFPSEYNTAATGIASFGISLGTTVMNPVSIAITDAFGWRNRFRVAAIMQLCISLPAVLLWGQPHEEATKNGEEKDEFVEKNENNSNNKEETEEVDSYNMFTDVCFWAWLFGTTFWSLDFAIGFMSQNGISRESAGAVMSAFGITELVSRIVCAVTGEQKVISKAMIYILASLVGAAGFLVPIIAYQSKGEDGMSVSLMYVFAVVVGFVGGVLNCLIMACTVDIFGQKRTIAVWNYVSIMLGVGFVGGPPIGSFFVENVFDGETVYIFYLAIVFFILCALIMLPIPIATRKRANNEKIEEVPLN